MARSEEQVATNENASTSPERTEGVIICANPNIANGAMRPNMETFVALMLEAMFVVVGLELTDDVCVFGFMSVFWFAFLCDWIFSLRTTRRFVTFCIFVATFLQTFLDFVRVNTALSLARLIRWEFGTAMRGALAVVFFVVDSVAVFFVFRSVLRGLSRLILTRFRGIFGRFSRSFSCSSCHFGFA
jgi:hypothetical protein